MGNLQVYKITVSRKESIAIERVGLYERLWEHRGGWIGANIFFQNVIASYNAPIFPLFKQAVKKSKQKKIISLVNYFGSGL